MASHSSFPEWGASLHSGKINGITMRWADTAHTKEEAARPGVDVAWVAVSPDILYSSMCTLTAGTARLLTSLTHGNVSTEIVGYDNQLLYLVLLYIDC